MRQIETLLAHAGCEIDPTTGAVSPPIHLSTTFERDPDTTYPRGFVYSRSGNPTRDLLEKTLAEVEGGEQAFAFSSGMAAATAILSVLMPGEHVIIPDDVYYTVRVLLESHFGQRGIEFTEVDQTDLSAVEDAMRSNTRLVWAESPSNPMVKIVDLARLAEISRSGGAELVVDSTWTTPLLQRPLDLGASYVMHSLTKYFSGHSDTLAGALIAAEGARYSELIATWQTQAGPVAGPFDCWLILRGMRSLVARMKLHCANARAVAGFLATHPRVSLVHYPGLPDHPGHQIAKQQMTDYGAMLSFEINGSTEDAIKAVAGTQVFTRATSLGGTESLIEHRASIETPPSRTPGNLIRISVGLEAETDLISDMSRVLG